MNNNAIQILDFYCKNEVCTLKESEYLSKIIFLLNSLDLDVDISFGEALDAKKNSYPKRVYLSISIIDKDGEIVMVNPMDFEHLTDASQVLEIDRKGRVSFFTWQEDKDFIDSLEWMIVELQKMHTDNE